MIKYDPHCRTFQEEEQPDLDADVPVKQKVLLLLGYKFGYSDQGVLFIILLLILDILLCNVSFKYFMFFQLIMQIPVQDRKSPVV